MKRGRYRIDTRERRGEWKRLGDSDVVQAAEAVARQQVKWGQAGRVVDCDTGAVVFSIRPASWSQGE